MKPFLIVGAGFSGAVLARELACHTDRPVLLIDERAHVAGNCHTEIDESSGVLVHKHGPHIFHTDKPEIWAYVNRFAEMVPFINQVKASSSRGVFPLPVNLQTINQFFNQRFSPQEARNFIASKADTSIETPKNFEEAVLKAIGPELYETFFKGYTTKQWGCPPAALPASLFTRLPLRFDYNSNYYNSSYQGLPQLGYTALIEKILDHPNITVNLKTPFDPANSTNHEAVFYTGSLDRYFQYRLGPLSYRTVTWTYHHDHGDAQGNAVINYPDLNDPHTRKIEYKHFTPKKNYEKTVVATEYSQETAHGDIPYYPKRLQADLDLLKKYRQLAKDETRQTYFLGRLATYRYLDMHQIIDEALQFSNRFLRHRAHLNQVPLPLFADQL